MLDTKYRNHVTPKSGWLNCRRTSFWPDNLLRSGVYEEFRVSKIIIQQFLESGAGIENLLLNTRPSRDPVAYTIRDQLR